MPQPRQTRLFPIQKSPNLSVLYKLMWITNSDAKLEINLQHNLFSGNGHIWRTNCLLKHATERKIEGRTEETGWRERIRKKIMETRCCSKLKEKAPDRFMWRTRLGGSCKDDYRMNEYPDYKLTWTSKRFLHALSLCMWVTFKPIYYLCFSLLSGGPRHNLPPLITMPTQTSSSLIPVYISFPVGHTFLPVL
jgi:hypothetical protein